LAALVGLGAALTCSGAASAQAVATRDNKPADYASVVQDIIVDRPIDVVMKKTSGYCDIGAWFKTTCTYTSGTGGLGTVRLIAGRVVEVMVAKTAYSYSYEQPPSFSPIFYHGTVEYLPDGQKTKIVYTLFYDDSNLADQAAKDKDQAGRRATFTGLLKVMKTVAEAP
jgi:hypothetical protein